MEGRLMNRAETAETVATGEDARLESKTGDACLALDSSAVGTRRSNDRSLNKKRGRRDTSRGGRARWSETRRVLGAVAKASRVIAFARVPVSSTSAPPRARGASGRTSRPSQPTRVRRFPRRRKRNETPSAGHTRVRLGPRPRPPPRALAVHAPRLATHARREQGLPPVRPHCAASAWREFDKYTVGTRRARTTGFEPDSSETTLSGKRARALSDETRRLLSREYLTG